MKLQGVYTISGETPFAPTLVKGLLAWAGNIRAAGEEGEKAMLKLARLKLLLPTRRAMNAVSDSFRHLSGQNRPLLLPAMTALGDDPDDPDLAAEEDDFNLPPQRTQRAISPTERLFLLARLLDEDARPPAQSLETANELAGLMDSVYFHSLDFTRLETLAPESYALHWQKVLKVLKVTTRNWPLILAERKMKDKARVLNETLLRQADSWRTTPPPHAVVAAGSTGTRPAVTALLKAIALLPEGAVVLPGVDTDMDDDSWKKAGKSPTHPQYALARLLSSLKLERRRLQPWPEEERRSEAKRLRLATLRACFATPKSGERNPAANAKARAPLAGVRLVAAANSHEEALAIALLMREVLETPDKRCALVTRDRALARRVAAEMRRFGVILDDSAGAPLVSSQPWSFLETVARLAADESSASTLLSLLKHPLAGGDKRAHWREAARVVERTLLRGPSRHHHLAGLLRLLEKHPTWTKRTKADAAGRARLETAHTLLKGVQETLAPLSRALAARASMETLLTLHVAVCEKLTTDDALAKPRRNVPYRLWQGIEGKEAKRAVDDALKHVRHLPPLRESAHYAPVWRALAQGRVVRPQGQAHPRLFIWGALEARLQHVHRIILGGMNDGLWPQHGKSDPWMSRAMRAAFGLPPQDERIGLAAHDFLQAFASDEVILSYSERRGGEAAAPSPFLLRLQYLLPANLEIEKERTAVDIARALNSPPTTPRPAKRPAPTPPAAARPQSLPLTALSTLIRDPYAVYARHVLNLKALPPLEDDSFAAAFGSAVHKALKAFMAACSQGALPTDAEERIVALCLDNLTPYRRHATFAYFQKPRLERMARQFIAFERDRRTEGWRVLSLECEGRLTLGGVTLRARADRLDVKDDPTQAGGGVAILDYKTGALPSHKALGDGREPQLPMEAAILAEGGFDETAATEAASVLLLKLAGTGEQAERRELDQPQLADTKAIMKMKVERLLRRFGDAATPYAARPRPQPSLQPKNEDYDHLARVLEWKRNA